MKEYSANYMRTFNDSLTFAEYINRSWIANFTNVIGPIITFFGFAGNGFGFISIICRKLYRKSHVFVFFMFLQSFDFLFVVLNFFHLEDKNLGYLLHTNRWLCKIYMYLKHSTMITSAWIIVAAMGFKLYGLARPFDIVKQGESKLPYKLCSIMAVLIFLAMSCNIFFEDIIYYLDDKNITVVKCYVSTETGLERRYIVLLMLAYSVVPGILLIIFSSGMAVCLAKSYRDHKKLLGAEGSNSAEASQTFVSAKNTVLMLLPISMLHVVCTLPLLIINIFSSSFAKTHESFSMTMIAWWINHTFGVYLQLMSSKFYRQAMLPCYRKST